MKPQLNQAQPCLICGNSLLRIWSLMSRVGDRYLRITNHNDNNNRDHKVVDCGGGLKIDNFTSEWSFYAIKVENRKMNVFDFI